MTAFVELHHTVLGDSLAIDAGGIECQRKSEAQWPVVKYLVVAVTVWHDQTVAQHDGRCAASQCGADHVGVVAVAVVDMKRALKQQGVAQGWIGFLHSHPLNVETVAFGSDNFGRILYPYINTVGFLTRPLQCRTIDTVGAAVVLPCDVVLAFLI